MIQLYFPCETEDYHFSADHKRVEFLLALGKGFPDTAPRLYLKSVIGIPSFSDCRDFLESVLREDEWNPRLSLKNIAEKVPEFLAKLKKT